MPDLLSAAVSIPLPHLDTSSLPGPRYWSECSPVHNPALAALYQETVVFGLPLKALDRRSYKHETGALVS